MSLTVGLSVLAVVVLLPALAVFAAWRRRLSEAAHRPGAGPEIIVTALDHVQRPAERSFAAA